MCVVGMGRECGLEKGEGVVGVEKGKWLVWEEGVVWRREVWLVWEEECVEKGEGVGCV